MLMRPIIFAAWFALTNTVFNDWYALWFEPAWFGMRATAAVDTLIWGAATLWFARRCR